jgi:hypothetical protein
MTRNFREIKKTKEIIRREINKLDFNFLYAKYLLDKFDRLFSIEQDLKNNYECVV